MVPYEQFAITQAVDARGEAFLANWQRPITLPAFLPAVVAGFGR